MNESTKEQLRYIHKEIRNLRERYPSAFTRLVQGQIETSNYLTFNMFFKVFKFFFILRSHPLSSLVSLFLHTSLHYLEVFNLSFRILASLVQFRTSSTFQPWAVWPKTSAKSGVMSCDFSTGSFVLTVSKIFCRYIIFRTSTQSSWSHFLWAFHPHNSRGISTVFYLP